MPCGPRGGAGQARHSARHPARRGGGDVRRASPRDGLPPARGPRGNRHGRDLRPRPTRAALGSGGRSGIRRTAPDWRRAAARVTQWLEPPLGTTHGGVASRRAAKHQSRWPRDRHAAGHGRHPRLPGSGAGCRFERPPARRRAGGKRRARRLPLAPRPALLRRHLEPALGIDELLPLEPVSGVRRGLDANGLAGERGPSAGGAGEPARGLEPARPRRPQGLAAGPEGCAVTASLALPLHAEAGG